MESRFSEVEKRVKRYWFEDGLAELAGGAVFLLIGLYFVGNAWLPQESLASVLLNSSLVILLVGGAFLARWLVNSLKTRLTYPRTGYVEYHPNKKATRSRRIWTAIVAVVVSISIMEFGQFIGSFNWLVAFDGVIIGVIYIINRAWSEGLTRFYLLAALSVVSGLALSLSGLSVHYGLGLFNGLIGLASMLSGGVTLARYLSANPLPGDETQ